MTSFVPFELERMLSRLENTVEFDLSESGVHPVTLKELTENDPAILNELLDVKLNYAQTNGTPELRERVSALYPGASLDNVIVTVGCAEANFLAMNTVVEPGDEIAMMLPNYMQVWGVAKNLGMRVKAFHLLEELGWSLDYDELNAAVSKNTKLIAVCNPNNPTGHILSESEMDAIVEAASGVGAWILADEVYGGTERLTDIQTASFFGRYDKVIATNSLSKAYGLPGLRIGWAVAPTETVDELWARHDYTTIGTTMLSNKLAAFALEPEVRRRLVGRAQELVRVGLPIMEEWMASQDGVFDMVLPQASPIAFAKYDLEIGSVELVEMIREERSVLLVPGAHFGMEGHLRFRYGLPPDYLQEGLKRVGEIVEKVRKGATK